MVNTSVAYKEQIRKSTRNPSLIKINFGIIDPDAVAGATISDNGKLYFAQEPDINDIYAVSQRYGTLEPGVWLLDGTVATLDESELWQGFISYNPSDNSDNCAYTTEPALTITFDQPYAFRGLGINFDTVQNLYPKNVTIKAYLSNELVFNQTLEVDSATWTYNSPVPSLGSFADKIVFSFPQNRLPHQRLRVEQIILGVKKTLTEDVIISADWVRSNDLMNTVLPSNKFSYSFYDVNKEYNPDNPDGVWEYLETGQQVSFSLGYELDDGSVEWIQCGKNYTDGKPTIQKAETLGEVTFNTVSKLEQLVDVYDEGVYKASGATLYSLAQTVLRWSGCMTATGADDFELDNSLKNYLCYCPLPQLEARQLLQLIANAGMCLLGVNRLGKIFMSPRTSVAQDFEFTLSDVVDNAPTIDKYPYLKDMYFTMNSYTLEDTSEIAQIEVVGASQTLYTIDYSAATDLSVNVSLGLTLNSTKGLYAQRAKVIVTGTGTITITGKALKTNSTVFTKNFNPVGEDCSLENELVGSQAQALAYIDWMASILQLRNVYTFSDRGFPELDVSDIVQLDTAYTDAKNVVITGTQISFIGGISGETEVLG